MTIKHFEGLSVEEQNQAVCEAMGKCWHEWDKIEEDYTFYRCKKCSKEVNVGITKIEEYESENPAPDNPNYLTSDTGLKEMLEWLNKQDEDVELILGRNKRYYIRSKKFSEIEADILNYACVLSVLKSADKVEEE